MRPSRSTLTRAACLALPLLLALAPSSADAQGRRRSSPPQQRRERPQLAVEGAGLFTSTRGLALGDVGDGTGLDVMASIGAGMFSVGAGYQRVWHSQAGNDDDVPVDGAFIEPRLALPVAVGNFTPYLLGRAARLTRRPPGTGAGSDAPELKGTALGAGIGNLFWLTNNVQLNTAVLWQDLRLDRAASVNGAGSGARVGGSQWVLRAGLTIGFDDWGR